MKHAPSLRLWVYMLLRYDINNCMIKYEKLSQVYFSTTTLSIILNIIFYLKMLVYRIYSEQVSKNE